MSVAARWAGWAQRLRNTPGPLQGASLAGLPFLTDVLGPNTRIAVEMAFGADLAASPDTWPWVDITAYVRQADGQTIQISPMGRGDETSQSQPAGCAFQVDNDSGDFSKSRIGRWYPFIRRNTPVRVRVTIDGSSWFVRFQGQANGFTPGWDTSAKLAIVSVSASGKLRQLQQGKRVLRSALYRTMSGAAIPPSAYWPLEDGADGLAVSQGVNAISGGAPMVGNSASNFHATTGAPGSDAQPNFSAGGALSGKVPSASGVTSWRVQCLAKFNTINTGDFAIPLEWNTADGTGWELIGRGIVDGGLGYSDTNINSFSSNAKIDDGLWHELRATASQSGGNIALVVSLDGVTVINQTFPGTVTAITRVFSNRGGSVTNVIAGIGHFMVWNGATTIPGLDTVDGMRGHSGETATARLARLCAEEGVLIDIRGSSDTAMGAQGVDTLVNLLRECETADDGVLYDGRGPGLSYAARSVRYNAAAALTADMAADPPQVDDPFTPVDDDQRDRNLVRADRKNGGTATYEGVDGPLGTAAIGTYDSSLTVNISSDDGLLNRAAHEVKKGTVDSPYRHPSLNLDLAATVALAPGWLLADVSSRLDIANVTSKATQYPPGDVDLLLEGWAETLGPFDWVAAGNCSPFQPWRVGVIEGAGDTTWRIDSGSSTLVADADVGATSISVASTDPAELWSTSGSDYPRDVDVGGVQVTATAVAGAVSPQTFTVDPLPYRLAAGWQVKLWRPPTIAL